jgi:hypothetical protein
MYSNYSKGDCDQAHPTRANEITAREIGPCGENKRARKVKKHPAKPEVKTSRQERAADIRRRKNARDRENYANPKGNSADATVKDKMPPPSVCCLNLGL